MLASGLTGGCLRLRTEGTDSESETTSSPDAETATETDSPAGAQRLSLSERWTADFGVDFILTDDGQFYFNDYNRVARAIPGDGILWQDEITYEGSETNLGADAIARGDDLVVFGFWSEFQSVDRPGAHFVGHDVTTGEQLWAFTVPVAAENDSLNLPKGAGIAGDLAVVGVNEQDQYSVYGLDSQTGEQVWSNETRGGINNLETHDSGIYLDTFGGVTVLDPATGSVIEQDEPVPGVGQIHIDSAFATADDELRAYPLTADGVEWSTSGVPDASTVVVDNSLVVIGTRDGNIQTFERATGEKQWGTTIEGTVWQIELSPSHVWVADRETGLTAYDRQDGRNVHRSTKPISRGDIAVISQSILLGNDTARLYDIQSA
jgi:hypothetical protein